MPHVCDLCDMGHTNRYASCFMGINVPYYVSYGAVLGMCQHSILPFAVLYCTVLEAYCALVIIIESKVSS